MNKLYNAQCTLSHSEQLKKWFLNYILEIEKTEKELEKQIKKKIRRNFPMTNKIESLDCYNKARQKIITYYYDEVTGNRVRTVLLTKDIVIRRQYKSNVFHSQIYADCVFIKIYDNRPESDIRKVTLILNGHGGLTDSIYEVTVDFNGEKARAVYNADGVLLSNHENADFNFIETK